MRPHMRVRLPSKDEIALWLSARENQARLIVVAWYIAIGMMVLGYAIMAYLLFFQ